MTEAIINVSKRFELIANSNNGNFVTGLSISYEVRNSITNALFDSGTMSEVSGLYYFDVTFTSLGQYRVLYITPNPYENAVESVDVITAYANADDVSDIISEIDDNEAKLDSIISSLSTLVSDIWSFSPRTLTSFGTLVADIWAYVTRELTGIGTSGIASESDASSNTSDIITEIDANETKIDALPTANQIADQVWDEALADHLSAGSTGEALDDADAVADPDAVATAVWAYSTRTLTSFGTLVADIWANITRTLTGIGTSGIASEANATTNKNDIITQINDNETKIDSIQSDVTQILSDIAGLNDLAIVDIQTALTNQGYTIVRAAKLDNLDVAVSTRSSHTPADVRIEMDANSIDLNSILANIASLNDISIADVQTALTNQGYTIVRATKLDNLDATVSSRASEVNATANKDEVIAEVDENETKIDALSTQLTTAETTIIAEINANEVKLNTIITNVSAHRTAVETKITNILGLSQHNTQIKDQVYDGDDNLISATIRLYSNGADALNDNNHIKEYFMLAEYDVEGKLTKYVVKE